MTYQEAFVHPKFKEFFEEEIESSEKLRRKILLEGHKLKSAPYTRLFRRAAFTLRECRNAEVDHEAAANTLRTSPTQPLDLRGTRRICSRGTSAHRPRRRQVLGRQQPNGVSLG